MTKVAAKVSRRTGTRRITFSLYVENAREVVITGDFCAWSVEGVSLHQIHDGEWCCAIDLPPGEYQYRLRVDGQWRDDPEAERRIPNGLGSENCILTVP